MNTNIDKIYNITNIPINQIKPYPNNPRLNHNAVEKVKNSIKEFGFQNPLILDKDYTIIAGHTRYLAAKELNFTYLPCHIPTLSAQQIRAFRIADNKTHEFATWDNVKLIEEIAALMEEDYDLSLMGYSTADIERYTQVSQTKENWVQDFDITPKPRSKFILISAPEDICAEILSSLKIYEDSDVKIESSYAGGAKELKQVMK